MTAILATVGPATIVAVVFVGVAVAAIAVHLLIVIHLLRRTRFALGTVLVGVRAIAARTEPVGEVVASIALNVTSIEDSLRSLLPQPEEAGKSAVVVPHGGGEK